MGSTLLATVIAADERGVTHFGERAIALHEGDFAPPAPPLETSEPVAASRGLFFRMPAGWSSDWHPTPCVQFYVQTSGLLEVEVGTGETRRFLPGQVVLVMDTEGAGHRTRVLGDEDVCGVFLQLV